jgi:hypothetical protein
MAEAVVDVLEVVEIDDAEGGPSLGALHLLQLLLEPPFEVAAIGKSGQPVMVGKVDEFGLQRAIAGDFLAQVVRRALERGIARHQVDGAGLEQFVGVQQLLVLSLDCAGRGQGRADVDVSDG